MEQQRASTRRRRRLRPMLVGMVGLSLVGTACTEEPPADTALTDTTATDGSTGATSDAGNGDGSVVGQFAGEAWFAGEVPDRPVAAEGEPIKVGHINQEDVPFGSFPEVRLGTEAAVTFINAELGGIHGRPIELITCIANFSVEGSQACAQQMVQEEVVAVVGGLDITSNGSIPVFEQNGIPYVGGIPVNFDEMQSPVSFQFSGGSPGAMVAFASDAVDNGADSVAVVYADFGPVKSAALDFGVRLLREEGVPTVTEVAYPITATDMLPILAQAAADDPDAILMFAADAACVRTMETAVDLGLDADLYMVGSCAAPAILGEAGAAADGTIFSIEGPIEMDTGVVDGPLYFAASEQYGPDGYDAPGAGTVSFRATMNLWKALNALDPDHVDSEALIAHFQEAVDEPSFDGHAYTCDGAQVPTLPALCAPQQVLVQYTDDTIVPRSDGWIDVPAILRGYE